MSIMYPMQKSASSSGPVDSFRPRASGHSQIPFEVEAWAGIPAHILMGVQKLRCVHIFRYDPPRPALRADSAAHDVVGPRHRPPEIAAPHEVALPRERHVLAH